MWKGALLVIFQRKRLISFQEEHRWKSCTHDVGLCCKTLKEHKG